MRFVLRGFLAIALLMLFSCSSPVDIEGDVFLVKGDGKPQPSAAKQVIFIKAESFESILIESYLGSVQEEAQKNAAIYLELCATSSAVTQKNIDTLKAKLSSSFEEGVNKNITDKDGSCTLLIKAADDSSNAASSSNQQYKELLAIESSKIATARKEITSLKRKLEGKIFDKTTKLYNDFAKNIDISIIKRGINITNNTNYNIKLDQAICLQFYNELGDPVGHSADSTIILSNCQNYQKYDYETNGTLVKASLFRKNISEDSFGFSKGGYLAKGQSVNVGFSTKGSEYYSNNFFCRDELTASQKLKFTKQYGENKKDWPDIFSPVADGYKVLQPSSSAGYGGDREACGLTASSRFIPLEDEVKKESGDEVSYESLPISFRAIAMKEQYPERSLIKKQEAIIQAAQKETNRINNELAENKLIAQQATDSRLVKECKSYTELRDKDNSALSNFTLSLATTNQCDINNGSLSSALNLEAPGDLAKLESLSKVDYSAKAKLAVLNKFKDSPYKTSTNISGHYSLKEVPAGNYVIYSSYQDNFNEGIYLINKEIKEGTAVDLSNANFLEVGSLVNVLDVFYEKCSEKVCGEEDLRNTLDIQEAVRRNKERMKALEDLEDSLEKLKNLLDY